MTDEIRSMNEALSPLPRAVYRLITAAACVLALVGAAGGAWLIGEYVREQQQAAAKPEPWRPIVRTLRVQPAEVPVREEATGFLRSPATVRVAAETAGQLLEKLPEEGDQVAEGDIVARLDDRVHRRRIEAADARATALRTQLDYVEKELAREEELLRLGSGRAADVDRWRSEKQRIDAAILENEAGAAEARLFLEKCEVRAPRDGVWLDDLAERGEYLAPGQPIGLLRQVDPLELEVEVSGALRLALTQGIEVDVEILDADPDINRLPTRLEGCRVRSLPPGESPATRRFPVLIEVPNSGRRWIPGLFARVVFRLERARAVLLVPKEAVVSRNGKTAVHVVAESDGVEKVGLRYVTVRSIADDPGSWVVSEGLEPGTEVIVEPLESLREGLEIAREGAESDS